ncbi:MAG TPA: glycosyltransferase family 4 protein [Rhodocyclaceae bacterium]|nr:glycosyltransferase family 4 protein [Rhodocyclaceae bacterium]
MKLAIVRQKYTPFGGAERFVERALAALRNQGTDVTVIAREWEGAADAGFLRCDPFYLGRTWRDAGFCRGVQRIVADGRFDLVQSHERIPGCHIFRAGDGVHATWLELRDRTRGRLARLATALSPWHRYTRAAEAAMFRHGRLRAVICNSKMVRDDIARRFGVAEERLHVIHNGVDLARFRPALRDEHRRSVRQALAIADDVPVILFVGSGFERKGLAVLLQALAGMARTKATLLVVGRDGREGRYRRQAEELGLAGRVRFLGGREDVRPYYGAADCFALPTLYDPLPNAALEALACGLPVATSTSCGAAELIEEGKSGYICDALDVRGLSQRLDALCEPGAPSAMGPAARRAVEGLDLAVMAARLTALYGTLAA